MTSASLSTPMDYALYYLQVLGFSVFVLKNEPAADRKRPAIESWTPYMKQLASEEQINQWFADNPNYNLAVATGTVSKIIAFDVDGPTAIKRIEAKRIEMSTNLRVALDNTMMNKTGSGGLHIIFKIEDYIGDLSQRVLWTDGKTHSQILLQANGHYVVVPPSIHSNNKHYEWNEKNPHPITRQELNELIRLLRPSQDQQPPSVSCPIQKEDMKPPINRTLSTDKMQELLRWIKPFYTPGNRDYVLFYLSGMMRKNGGYPLENTRTFIKLLCHASEYPDEDLDKSLTVVDNTYRKPLDELNGKAGLHDLIVESYQATDEKIYLARTEAFSQICQIINNNSDNLAEELPQYSGANNSDFLGDDKERKRDSCWLDKIRSAYKNPKEDCPVIPTLTNEVMRINTFKTLTDTKEILWYHNGVYEHGGEEKITKLLEELGAYYVTETVRTEVTQHIRYRTLTDRREFDKDIHLVNFKNCVVDLRSEKILEHDPKYLFTQQIPVNYKPDLIRTPRRILDFLYNVVHPSDVPLVIEFIGYCLIRDCRFQKALMLAGPPDAGKSTFLLLLSTFLGENNIADKTMQQLTENRFATAGLFGKLANIFADLSSNRLRDISMFKVLVSGDRISAERKFRQDFEFKPYTKLVFSANLPPLPPEGISDEDAYYKRWFVVSFNLRRKCFFCGQKIVRDPKLLEKLTTEEELTGLAYLAVKAVQRLISRSRFVKSPSIEAVTEEYQKKANPVKAWADARCIFYEEYQTDKDVIEADFIDYCERRKLPSIKNRVHLGRELKSLYNVTDQLVGAKKERKHIWKGIALRKDLRAKGQIDLEVWEDTDEVDDSEYSYY